MLCPRRVRLAVCAVSLAIVPAHAWAECPDAAHHVAPDGDDAGAGTLEDPWATINFAISATGPGDCVLVHAGDYEEGGEIWVREGQGGAEGQTWSLEAYPGDTPVLHTRLILQGNDIRVRGLTMASGAPIISWYPATRLEILGNHFAGSYLYAAVQVAGSDILVEGNEILLDGSGSTQDHGIYVLHGSNKTVRDNVISNAPGYGVHVYDEDKYDWSPDISNVTIERNVVTANAQRAAFLVATSGNVITNVTIARNIVEQCAGGVVLRSGAVEGVALVHNTFVDVGAGISIEERPGPAGVTIHNNIVWGLVDPALALSGGTPTVDDNTWGPGRPSTGDAHPSFADPLVGTDFRLAEGSPAIDAGLDLGATFSGAAPDHGACEFGDAECPSGGGEGDGDESATSVGDDNHSGDGSGSGPDVDTGSNGGADQGTADSADGTATGSEGSSGAAAGGDIATGGCSCSNHTPPGPFAAIMLALLGLGAGSARSRPARSRAS